MMKGSVFLRTVPTGSQPFLPFSACQDRRMPMSDRAKISGNGKKLVKSNCSRAAFMEPSTAVATIPDTV